MPEQGEKGKEIPNQSEMKTPEVPKGEPVQKESPISEWSFRQVQSRESRLLASSKKAQTLEEVKRINEEIAELASRREKLAIELKEVGGFDGLNERLAVLRAMAAQGSLTPRDIYNELNVAARIGDDEERGSPYAGLREWYYRGELDDLLKEVVGKQKVSPGEEPETAGRFPSGIEKEIFGEEDAFSERWAGLHGLPKVIEADPVRGIMRPFFPAEVFSDIAETGLSDQPAWYRASLAIELSRDKGFRRAARTGFLPLLALNHTMKARRIDSVVKLLQTEMGVTPQGIAQWLSVDQETRRALTLLFRLQGYEVADEVGENNTPVHDEIKMPEGKLPKAKFKFSEYDKLEADQIEVYLRGVQEVIGTDYGVVRLAYTIFRCLGFPHENDKFAGELIKKYVYDGQKGDLESTDINPFLEKPKDSVKKGIIEKILAKDGVPGLAKFLVGQKAEQIARDWADLQLFLDMMDAISDIRTAQGKYAGLEFNRRHAEIVKEMGILLAKRKLSPTTIKRLQDPSKIQTVGEASPSLVQNEMMALRKIWRDFTGGSRRKEKRRDEQEV